MNILSTSKQKGIGLIEVLIAAVIFALGSIALIQLQGTFFQSSSAANSRSVAMNIAEEKIEDLRSLPDFTAISSNVGGTEACTETFLDSSSTTISCATSASTISEANAVYELHWEVDDYYYNAGTLTSTASGNVVQKDIIVTVSWVDADGSTQSLQANSIINSASVDAGGTLAVANGGSGEKPYVPHTELAVPDVIPGKVYLAPPPDIDDATWSGYTDTQKADAWARLGRCNVNYYRSTEAPDPELDENSGGIIDNTIVGFATTTYLTYDTCSFTSTGVYDLTGSVAKKIKYEEEEFKTINCSCELAASGDGYDQGHNSVTKALTGVKEGQSNQQSDFCDICCRDHHENITGDYQCSTGSNLENCYDPERTAASDYTSNDHKHYSASDLTTPVTSVGDQYDEVCRIKRVDGFYTVVQDWKLLALNTMVEADLTDATIGISGGYQEYIGTTVNQYLGGTGTTPPAAWSAPSPSVPSDGSQMMARAIYIDYLSAADKSSLAKSGADIAFTDIDVPFYEYKVTDLVDWKTTNTDGTNDTNEHTSTASPCPASGSANDTCVDSPTISQIINVNNNQTIDKGIYRTNSPTQDIHIIAEMKGSPTGVVAGSSIEPNDELAATTYTSKFFVDNGTGTNTGNIGIELASSPGFTCPAKWGNGNGAPNNTGSTTTSWSSVTLSCSPSSGNAATCEDYSSDQGSVTVTAANTGSLTCTFDDSSTQTCPSTFDLSVSNLTGTKTCSIQLTKQGNSAECDLVCN